jgi:hypothetical protein
MTMPTKTPIFSSARRNAMAFGVSALLGFVCLTDPALADDTKDKEKDIAAAANAFARAQRAEVTGDHDRAAEFYELADSIAPTPEALRAALRARLAAGQRAIAASHAETLLERYSDDSQTKALAEQTLSEISKDLGRYQVSCQPSACSVLVDGQAVGTEARLKHVVYLEPGAHKVVGAFGQRRAPAQAVDAAAGDKKELVFDEPPPDPKTDTGAEGGAGVSAATAFDSSKPPPGGLSPAFFATGASLTLALGLVSLWSGLDVLKKHDKYESEQALNSEAENRSRYEDGRDREQRTNILFAATGAAALGTVALAIFTDWSGSEPSKERPPTARVGVRSASNGFMLGVDGSF